MVGGRLCGPKFVVAPISPELEPPLPMATSPEPRGAGIYSNVEQQMLKLSNISTI